ncbi:MAG: elongation factor G [Thermoguttaceae bacterium]|nr:elongation factor G [Thermoguttaceae bacterium]
MSTAIEKIRNLGIIAHIDAGKTTCTERILYYSGFNHKVGSVDEGTTTTDFDEEEQERGITIYSAAITYNWNGCSVNLIDTPGHVDFTAEVERSLRVLDGAAVIFSAREGVEAQSETVWRQADKYNVPRLAFINKMDREGADFDRTVNEIQKRLGANPLVLTIPVGAGPDFMPNPFRGTIDLVQMKMLVWDQESKGMKFDVQEIPEEMKEEAELWRTQLLDQLSMFSDEITELMLAEEEVPVDLIHKVIRDATIHLLCVPVLCGTALHYIGIQPLMDALCAYLPSPLDIPPVEGIDPKAHDPKNPEEPKKIQRKTDPKEAFCGLVFKVVPSKHGDLSYLRIYSGTLKPGSRVLNVSRNEKENVPQIYRLLAGHKELMKEPVYAGDIVGIVGLSKTITGDTLSETNHPILLESIEFPETVISMAIEPETTAERKKLDEVLEMMRRQDPTFQAVVNPETGQTLISGMGELHLEIIKHRLLRDFKLNVRVRPPRVSYRETIKTTAEVVGECSRKIGDTQLFAQVKLKMEPFTKGDKSVLVIPMLPIETPCPLELQDAVVQTLRDQADGGGMYGFPLIHIKMTVQDVIVDETTNETAVNIAAADAFNKAVLQAGIDLMEPIMKVEVTTPDECVGGIIGDLQQRRAQVNQTYVRGNSSVIEAEAPLDTLFGYANDVKSLSQGRASFSMEPLTYRPAPKEVVESFN